MKPRLGEIRKSKGLEQKYVANKIGIGFQRLSDWERGKGMPRYDKAYSLAKIYGVTMEELYEEE